MFRLHTWVAFFGIQHVFSAWTLPNRFIDLSTVIVLRWYLIQNSPTWALTASHTNEKSNESHMEPSNGLKLNSLSSFRHWALSSEIDINWEEEYKPSLFFFPNILNVKRSWDLGHYSKRQRCKMYHFKLLTFRLICNVLPSPCFDWSKEVQLATVEMNLTSPLKSPRLCVFVPPSEQNQFISYGSGKFILNSVMGRCSIYLWNHDEFGHIATPKCNMRLGCHNKKRGCHSIT